MTLIKKCDVKMHFASRGNKGLHLVKYIDTPGVAILPIAETAIESDKAIFIEDFSSEHSSAGGALSAVVIVANSGEAKMPETRKSPQS